MNDTYEEIQKDLEEISKPEELTFTESSLLKLKKEELLNMCEERGLELSGTKSDLVERLIKQSEEVLEATSTITFVSDDERKEEEVVGKAKRV